MSDSKNVLLIDNNFSIADKVMQILYTSPFASSFRMTETVDTAKSVAAKFHPDVVIFYLQKLGSSSMKVLKELEMHCPASQFIFVTDENLNKLNYKLEETEMSYKICSNQNDGLLGAFIAEDKLAA